MKQLALEAQTILDDTVAHLDNLRKRDALNSANVNAALTKLKNDVSEWKERFAKALAAAEKPADDQANN